jgi:hypothetical protein
MKHYEVSMNTTLSNSNIEEFTSSLNQFKSTQNSTMNDLAKKQGSGEPPIYRYWNSKALMSLSLSLSLSNGFFCISALTNISNGSESS